MLIVYYLNYIPQISYKPQYMFCYATNVNVLRLYTQAYIFQIAPKAKKKTEIDKESATQHIKIPKKILIGCAPLYIFYNTHFNR